MYLSAALFLKKHNFYSDITIFVLFTDTKVDLVNTIYLFNFYLLKK